jgi:hypothetical protein
VGLFVVIYVVHCVDLRIFDFFDFEIPESVTKCERSITSRNFSTNTIVSVHIPVLIYKYTQVRKCDITHLLLPLPLARSNKENKGGVLASKLGASKITYYPFVQLYISTKINQIRPDQAGSKYFPSESVYVYFTNTTKQ